MTRFLFLTSVLLFPPAAEASFGGKIKNIRIRERNNSQGYRVVVVVQDDCNNATCDYSDGGLEKAEPTVTFNPLDGSPSVDDPTDSGWVRETRFFRTDRGGGLVVNDTISASEGDIFLNVNPPDDGSWDEAANDLYTLAMRQVQDDNGDTQLEVRIQGVSKDTSLSGIDSITIDTGDGEEVAADFVKSRARRAYDVSSAEDLTDALFDLDVEIKVDGDVIDEVSRTVSLSGDPRPMVEEFTLKSKSDTKSKAVVITSTEEPGSDLVLFTEVSGLSAETQIVEYKEDAPVGRELQFEYADLAFDDVPSGLYNITLTMRDKEGATVGEPVDVEIDHIGEDGATAASFDWAGSSQALVATTSGSNVSYTVALTGDKAGSVYNMEFQFNEPFEGPTPQESVLTADFAREFQKWVFGGEGLGDETEFNYGVELRAGDGSVIDTLSGDVELNERGIGRGTRVTGTGSSTRTELL